MTGGCLRHRLAAQLRLCPGPTSWSSQKKHDFAREGRQKSRFSSLAGGQQNRASNDPKMSPKSTPKRLPEGQNVAQKRCWISGSIVTPILTLLGVPKGNNRIVKKCPKSLKNRPRRPRAAQRPPGTPPEASREPFWPHFGSPGSSFSNIFRGFEEPQQRPGAPQKPQR